MATERKLKGNFTDQYSNYFTTIMQQSRDCHGSLASGDH